MRQAPPPPPGTVPDAPADAPAPAFTAEPSGGRVYAGSRAVRSTDVTPAGRLRLDALARYLQDVAEDDVAGTGWQAPYAWLLRRCVVAVRGYPRFGDLLRLRTFCSATGPRWAQRTTTVAGPGGDLIQATAVWVSVDRSTGRPCPLGAEFHRLYGGATQGRRVSARLSLPGPEDPAGAGGDGSGGGRDWPLRATDFDTAGHVNNSIYWAAAEDVLVGLGWRPARAVLEYQRPMLPGSRPRLLTGPAARSADAGPGTGGASPDGPSGADGPSGDALSGDGPSGAGRSDGSAVGGRYFWLADGDGCFASGHLAP